MQELGLHVPIAADVGETASGLLCTVLIAILYRMDVIKLKKVQKACTTMLSRLEGLSNKTAYSLN